MPVGRPVDTLDEAWQAALEIGLPVVVKPQDGRQGMGVTVNIVSRDHLAIAFRAAAEHGQVMVEKFLPGNDYRLLVVGRQMVAAARRDPPQVIGDGVHTVGQLIDQVNADPRRGEGHATSLTKMRLDEIALARLGVQGLTPESVAEKGRRVILRNNANLSTGGSATDVTDDVHPELAARAVDAAEMIGDAARTRHVEEIRGEFAAIDRALARLHAGDLCLVLIDQVEEALAHLRMRIAAPIEKV